MWNVEFGMWNVELVGFADYTMKNYSIMNYETITDRVDAVG